jgi:hypothetical protein
MTMFEFLLSASAIGLTGGSIAYTYLTLRKAVHVEHASDEQIRRMIDTAPRGKFDNVLAR